MPRTTTDPPAPPPAKVAKAPTNSYPFWALRFWAGMRTRAYFGMLARNGYRIHPARWAMALIYAQMAPWNSGLHRIQQLALGGKIRRAEIKRPPIFIIGHWRSGTTHLHELMIRDERFAYPTTYECFAPHHFLITGWVLPKLFHFLLPRKRPMDNMRAGFQRPQEDEFGMVAMGAPTTYYRTAFPNEPVPGMDTLNSRDFSAADRASFRGALTYFMRALTVKNQKRLVLKSPPHTGRVEMLAEWFPGAKFVHISRHPYAIFPSMKHTWAALDEAQGFQFRTDYGAAMDAFIHDCYERMYKGFDQQRASVAPGDWCEVRYEDVAADPVGQVESIYDRLDLAGFEHARPTLESYAASLREYKPNKLDIEPSIKKQIDERWAWYLKRFGYEKAYD
ncbi:MAG: sulfotransferase [Planctomycetota bacterium]